MIGKEMQLEYERLWDLEGERSADDYAKECFAKLGHSDWDGIREIWGKNRQTMVARRVEAEKQAKKEADKNRRTIYEVVSDLKKCKLSERELSFLDNIKNKRKLTTKQLTWLEDICKKCNVTSTTQQETKLSFAQRYISFEDYVSEFHDLDIVFLSEKEKAEYFVIYQNRNKK